MRKLRNQQGFTLIELMIVVVIIGILAALAIPRFGAMSRSAKEGEADPVLKQAYTLQEAYFNRWGTYASDVTLTAFGWEKPMDSEYYTYTISTATATTFCTQAVSRLAPNNTRLPRPKAMGQARQVVVGPEGTATTIGC